MSPAAIRMRRYRARQKAGVVVLPIDAHEVVLADKLVAAGLLDPNDADDRDKLRLAISRVVQLWCRDA